MQPTNCGGREPKPHGYDKIRSGPASIASGRTSSISINRTISSAIGPWNDRDILAMRFVERLGRQGADATRSPIHVRDYGERGALALCLHDAQTILDIGIPARNESE